jgi:hypothetical protein
MTDYPALRGLFRVRQKHPRSGRSRSPPRGLRYQVLKSIRQPRETEPRQH